VREQKALGVLLSGHVWRRSWGASQAPSAGFYSVKGILEALCDALRAQVECVADDGGGGLDFLHPGRRAILKLDGEAVGWLGELHPLVTEDWHLRGSSDGAGVAAVTAAFELSLTPLLDAAAAAEQRSYVDVISFPELRRDLAVVLPEQVPAASVLASVRNAAGRLLNEVEVFDVYSGPQVGEGHRSLALSLSFRAPDRTLSEQDIAPLQQKIVAAIEAIGGQLRG
jgi:phenylalanyl-tRNA synthetase beta chain